jgi:4-hydroxy-2-oxoheptanedioate aldolase
MKTWRDEISGGRKIIGIWQQIPVPMVSRFLAQLGWDWIILDMQHGCFNWETTYECIHVIRTAGARPVVRTSIGQPAEVQKALDLGAGGVIVPMVNSVQEAVQMAAAAKYPPLGERSIGGDYRYQYGNAYPDHANESTVLLVQMEHIRAAENIDGILAVSGLDGCFVGPTDLALSMGLPRSEFEHVPEHRAAIQRTVDACRRAGKLACSNSYNLGEAQKKSAQGYDCITLRSDVDLFMDSSRDLLMSLRTRTSAGSAAQAAVTAPDEL